MKIDAFEKLLLVELSESITTESKQWTKSRFGIKRLDGLELYINSDDISVISPQEYIFKSNDLKNTLYKVANILYKKLQIEWEIDLYNKLVVSLTVTSQNWKMSIWGIIEKEYDLVDKLMESILSIHRYNSEIFELEINEHNDKLTVKKPYEYTFSNEKYERHLSKLAVALRQHIRKEEHIKKEQKSRDNLSEFLNFNDRKHKLKILQIIADEKEKEKVEKEKEKVKVEKEKEKVETIAEKSKKKNFFQKLFKF